MRKSIVRRAIVFGTAAVVGIAGIAVLAAPASAHIVTGMEATCARVTVNFNYFPDDGVPVTIVVKVGSAPEITKVVNISSTKTQANVNISGATSQLFGATADVTVDVTWTLHGHNHESEDLSVTCGSPTTTSTSTTSTSTTSTSTTTSTTSTSTTSSTTTTTTTTTQPKPPPYTGNGNIFQVELRRCWQLHIGYQNFPANTVIFWRVKQDSATVHGQLTTAAGSGYHFLTQPLGRLLNPSPHKGYIYYTWAIRGIKHTYVVGRQPGCTGTTKSGGAGVGDIFTVDVRHCNLVHLGYQYFPVNTNVTWMITQAGIPRASGYFITTAGAGYHFLMQPIGYQIESKTPAVVTFYWMQGATPLHYSVRKAPGC